jgi:hypothetical protein
MSDEPERPGEEDESVRSYVDRYRANWDAFEGSLWEKLALTARNRARSFTIGMGCCGHPGQPGC